MWYLRAAIVLGVGSSLMRGAPAIAEAPSSKPVSPAAAIDKEDEAARARFRGDERLERRVTVAQQDRPMGELLAALGRELAVPLTASYHLAGEETPVREVEMQVIMPRPGRGRAAVERGSGWAGTPAHGTLCVPVGRNDG